MPTNRILIASVSAGAGHVRAAKALEQAIQQQSPDTIVKHVDVLDYSSTSMRIMFAEIYTKLVTHAPGLWRFIYDTVDDERVVRLIKQLTNILHRFNCQAFLDEVALFSPTHIICTHSFPAQVLQSTDTTVPCSLVVTDYGFHKYWLTKRAHSYFVATPFMKEELESLLTKQAVPTKVVVSGIPVDPVFYTPINKEQVKKDYGITKAAHVILVLAGGEGLVRSDQVVKDIVSSPHAKTAHIIAVAGKNDDLKKHLDDVKKQYPLANITTLGWTDDMARLMKISDVVISKPGGMTVSECIATKTPLISISPIPGQEEQNAAYMTLHGYGVTAQQTSAIPKLLSQIFDTKKSSWPTGPAASHIILSSLGLIPPQ